MATKTWQNGGVDNNYSTAGNWVEGSKPTTGDDVVIAAAYNMVVNEATASLKSWDMTGYANTMSGSSAITIVGAASATDVVNFAGTITWSGTLYLNPTAADTIIELSESATGNLNDIGITAATNTGVVRFKTAITTATNKSLTLTKGVLYLDPDTASLSHSVHDFLADNTNVRGIYMGNCTLTVRHGLQVEATNLTVDDGASTVSIDYNGDNAFIDFGAGKTWYNVTTGNYNASYTFRDGATFAGTVTLQNKETILSAANTFNVLTVTGYASTTAQLRLAANQTVTDANFNGNSGINRLFVYSSTLGTARTITNTNDIVGNYVDFRDITLSNATDLSAGSVGDCGGNTGITFTTADDWFWNGSGTRNFSDYTYWYTATNGGGTQMAATTCPLPQDTCYINADSIDGATTIDQDLPRIPRIDFTGCAAMAFHMNNLSQGIYGSLTLVPNVTVTGGASSQTLTFLGRGASILDGYGAAGWNMHLYVDCVGGSLTLGSDYVGVQSGYTRGLSVTSGTFDANDYDVTVAVFMGDGTASRKILLGNGTWTLLNSSAGTDWDMTPATNLNIADGFAEGSTILTSDYNVANQFDGGGLAYNNLTIRSVAAIYTLTGSNTFNTFTVNAPKTVKFTEGTTTKIARFISKGGTAESRNSISSTTSMSRATLICNYAELANTIFTDIHVISYQPWRAFFRCYDGNQTGGNNRNILFRDITFGPLNHILNYISGEAPPVGAATGILTTRSNYWGDL